MDISVHEEKFLRQFLATQAIPYPKLLIKYHKKINKKGGFPTGLVIPETNFNTTFYELRYLRIKIIMNKAKVNYSRVSIVQAFKLKD